LDKCKQSNIIKDLIIKNKDMSLLNEKRLLVLKNLTGLSPVIKITLKEKVEMQWGGRGSKF